MVWDTGFQSDILVFYLWFFLAGHVVVQLFYFVTNTCNYAALCLTINSLLSDLFYGEVGKFIFACYFERVDLFICYYHVPLKNFSHLWRCHNYQWRTSNFDLCSALMAIEQWGFFSVQHLLWHGASVYNGHLRGPVTHSHLLPSVWQCSCHFLFLRLRDSNSQTSTCGANVLTDCTTTAAKFTYKKSCVNENLSKQCIQYSYPYLD